MASVFETAVDQIHIFLAADIVKGVYRTGVAKQEAPHRVVWVPVGGTIMGPRTTALRGAAGAQIPGSERVEVLASKILTVRAHIMSRTFEALEALHHDVLNAVDKALGKAATPGAFEIVSESDASFGHARGGIGSLVQLFEWDLVVPKRLQMLATVTIHEHDYEIDTTL